MDEPANGRTILYNSLYGSLAACDEGDANVLRRILEDPDPSQEGDSETRAVLIDQEFLIEDGIDEIAIVKARKRSGIHGANRLDVINMPTSDSNFSCTYSFEDFCLSRYSALRWRVMGGRWMGDSGGRADRTYTTRGNDHQSRMIFG